MENGHGKSNRNLRIVLPRARKSNGAQPRALRDGPTELRAYTRPTADDEAAASSAGGLAPLMTSHSMSAISPKKAG